jgi:hypothetical protein
VATERVRLGDWLFAQRRELRRARRAADAELLRLSPTPPRLAWRSAELTAGVRRLELGRELRRVVSAADARYLPGASPVDRPRVRAASDALLALADRLAELSRPVSPRGMLLLERLLNDADGPLYEGRATTTIAAALEEIAANLDDTA